MEIFGIDVKWIDDLLIQIIDQILLNLAVY